MAHLIFAQAKSIRKKALKFCSNLQNVYDESGFPTINHNTFTEHYNTIIEKERKEFCEIIKIAKLLHDDYQEFTGSSTNNYYFITIRPKENITLYEFNKTIEKFINRSCILNYTLSLEQKDPNGSGKGFHVHIITNTYHRSKGECLRDTRSTFKNICEPQCIEIITTKNPNDIINKYLLNYESKDNHKIITKEGDLLWRKKNNIDPLYNNESNPFSALSIKSNETELKVKYLLEF